MKRLLKPFFAKNANGEGNGQLDRQALQNDALRPISAHSSQASSATDTQAAAKKKKGHSGGSSFPGRKRKSSLLFLTQSAMIAALYVLLTLLSNALGLASGAIQLRLAEALTVLPAFTVAAIPGVSIGCLIANFAMASSPLDVLCGTLATLVGALGGYALRYRFYLVPLPTVLSNTLVIPFLLSFVYGAEGSLPFFILTVGIGELLSAGVLGILLYLALRPAARHLFG